MNPLQPAMGIHMDTAGVLPMEDPTPVRNSEIIVRMSFLSIRDDYAYLPSQKQKDLTSKVANATIQEKAVLNKHKRQDEPNVIDTCTEPGSSSQGASAGQMSRSPRRRNERVMILMKVISRRVARGIWCVPVP